MTDVSIAILTHARMSILPEALYSALRIMSSRLKEVVILNDCPEQTLVCRDPRVVVVNTGRLFTSVGAKRLAIAGLCTTEWIGWLDDDDLLLPHHLDKLSQLEGTAAHVLGSEQTYWFCGDKGEIKSGACADTFVRRSQFLDNGCPDLSVGEDWPSIERLIKAGTRVYDRSKNPSYIERWCNGVHHVSGQGVTSDAGERFRKNALALLQSGVEPHGLIELVPRAPILDYACLCAPILRAWWDRIGLVE